MDTCVGDTVIISSDFKKIKANVLGIEMFRKLFPCAEFEDNCGIILDVDKDSIQRGDLLSKI